MATNKSELFNQMFSTLTDADIVAGNLRHEISKAIHLARKKMNLSQKEFADYMGVTQGMVSKWESFSYNFTIESLAQICDKLSLKIELNLLNEGEEYKKAQRASALSDAAAYKQSYAKVFSSKERASLLMKAG